MTPNKIKEYIEHLKNQPSTAKTPFGVICRKISFLMMFSEIINRHSDELEETYKNAVLKANTPPATPLIDYILMEIRTFYHLAYGKFKKSINYPPYVMNELKNIRDKVVAHMLVEENKDVVRFYEEINKIGFPKIYSDWQDFRDEVYKKLE